MCNSLIFLECFSNEIAAPKTSITDIETYRNLCKRAAEDDQIFESFKRDPILIDIMQHVSYEQGILCLSVIKNKYPHLLPLLDSFRANDAIGLPITYEYDDVGCFSPTNLRYIKIAGDIEEQFSDRPISTIFEIGGGYGGQCKILCDFMNPMKYTIVDLPEPLALAKRHCCTIGLQQVDFVTMKQIDSLKSYDLVISNYAFSECNLEIQKMYLEKVIKNSKAGYMICNIIPYFETEKPFERNELVNILSGYGFQVKVLPETPLTAPNNYLLIWRK